MAKTLVENLTLVLVTVAIPFLIMLTFTLIRRGFGNAVTAMPDVLVFLFSVNLYFAVWPEPWRKIVHTSVRDSFPGLSVSLSLAAMVVFLLVMRVEKRIALHHLQRMWPVPNRILMPVELKNP